MGPAGWLTALHDEGAPSGEPRLASADAMLQGSTPPTQGSSCSASLSGTRGSGTPGSAATDAAMAQATVKQSSSLSLGATSSATNMD